MQNEIETVPSYGYARFIRAAVYQIIEDYFKLKNEKVTTELYEEFLRSERLLFADTNWMKHFDDLFDDCGLDASWVRRRVNRPSLQNVDWKSTPNIAKKVLGLCSYVDISPNYRRKMLRRLKLKLVKR